MSGIDYDLAYADRQLRRSRHPLRKIVKKFYLENVLTDVRGPAIDFGCGAGQILARLPQGSLGLEVNPRLVDALREQGLNAQCYDPEQDQLSFSELPVGKYQTFIMSHVLEHFDNAAVGLRTVLKSCKRLGVTRVILVLPGEKGFTFDNTHRTFVNREYVFKHRLVDCEGFSVSHMSYFPLNVEAVGKVFVFHEFKIIYDES
ncbi:MAG: class I SAM-dependent methyltransferase [Motiliproteus sp.]